MREGLRVDASLVAIILIVLISSALVIFTLAREKIDSPVVVLKNIYPEVLYTQASVTTRERMDFSFSVAARRDIETLEIRYATVAQSQAFFPGGNRTSGTLEGAAMEIAPTMELAGATDNERVPYTTVDVDASVGNLNLTGLFIDFPLVRLYNDPSLSGLVYSSFLLLENDTELIYFEGVSDFFFNRRGGYVDVDIPDEDRNKSSIATLSIRRNDEVTSYSSTMGAPSDWKKVEDAPDFGIMVFSNVAKDDMFSVDFTIETPKRPAGLLAQVISVYADGELVETTVNIME